MSPSRTQTPSVAPPPGVYVPAVAFFDAETEQVDTATITKHAIRLVEGGITGIVTQGSNGEAVFLSHEERKLITKTVRAAIDSTGRTDVPVIVGCGAQSTREAIILCKDAAESGGSFCLVLPPSYYSSLVTPEQVLQYFTDIADSSPIPIMIYNYPGASSGVDLNSDMILKLSRHKNIVGVKLTCGNTGKLARLAATVDLPFTILGGSADFTLQTLIVGGHGVIPGLGNIAPKACKKVFELYSSGKKDEARKAQGIVAKGDWVAIQSGHIGVKVALQHYFGYGGAPRKPCALPGKAASDKIIEDLAELMELENSL